MTATLPIEGLDHSATTSTTHEIVPEPKPAHTNEDARHSPKSSTASPSSSESSSLHSLQRTSFKRKHGQEVTPLGAANVPDEVLSLRRKPCVVTWSPQGHDDGEVVHEGVIIRDDGRVDQRRAAALTITGLACDLLYSPSSRSAIIKLKIPLLQHPRKDPVYLILPGESILSLAQSNSADSLQDDEATLQEVTNHLRHGSLCLSFSLRSRPILVVQPERIVPADCHNHILLPLHSLTDQTYFSIHMSKRSIPQNQQRPFQALISAASSLLNTSPAYNLGHTIGTLYSGRGARVVQKTSSPSLFWICDSPDNNTKDESTSSADASFTNTSHAPSQPPPYDSVDLQLLPQHQLQPQLQAPPFLDPVTQQLLKRRRITSDQKAKELPPTVFLSPSLDIQGVRVELLREVALVEERLERRMKEQSAVLLNALHAATLRLEQRLDHSVEGHRERMDKDIDHRMQEVHCAVEEQLLSCKIELQDHCKDERTDFEEALEEKLREVEQSLQASVLARRC